MFWRHVESLRNSAGACANSGNRAAIQLRQNNPLLCSSSRWRTSKGIYATSPTRQLSLERVSRLAWHPNLNSRPTYQSRSATCASWAVPDEPRRFPAPWRANKIPGGYVVPDVGRLESQKLHTQHRDRLRRDLNRL